jgi:DNA-binding transcriptional LysR family regulator
MRICPPATNGCFTRDFAPPPGEINAVYPSARHVSAKVRALTEFLKTEFEKIPALRVR